MSDKTALKLRESEGGELNNRWAYNPDENPDRSIDEDEGDGSSNWYDSEFKKIAEANPDVAERGNQILAGQRNPDSSRQAVQEKEKTAVGDTAVGKAAVGAANMVNPAVGKVVQFLGKIKTRNGAAGTIVAVVMVGLVALGSILGGSLAPFAFMANVVDDLNDQLASLDIRQEKLLRTKTKGIQNDFVNGCSIMSIRCKYRSVSKADVERLKSVGIEVSGKSIAGRVFPDRQGYTLEVDGRTRSMSARELADLIKTNPRISNQFREAQNMKFFGFADKSFRWFASKVRANLGKPSYIGATEEEQFKNFSRGITSPEAVPGAKFIQLSETDPQTGEPLYAIEGDTSPTRATYTEAQVKIFQERMAVISAPAVMPKPVAQIANIINVLGMNDLACTAKNMIGAAAIASKYAKSIILAKYSIEISAAVNAVKAGHGTEKDGRMVGNFFAKTDNRSTIIDVGKSIEAATSSSGGGYTVNTNNLSGSNGVSVANPFFGRNAMDSPLVKLSMADVAAAMVFTPTIATSTYMLGFSTTAAVVLSGIATIMDAIPLTSDTACAIIQNWGVRTIGFVVGIIAAIYSGGTAIIKNIAAFIGLTVIMVVITNILQNLVAGKPVPDDIDSRPDERGAAVWTGIGVTTGQTAQVRGMIPGDAQELNSYAPERSRVAKLYNAMEINTTSPFDTKSDKSMIGRIALAINRSVDLDHISLTNIATSARNIVASSIAAPHSQQVFADSINPSRLTMCDDKEYKELGVAADVQCNLRYYLPKDDLNSDPDDVAVWMEQQGYVEKDTVTGVPAGYTPPSSQESSNLFTSFLNGFVSSFYATRNYGSMNNTANPQGAEYAKFLDYCAYRSMPYGKTYEEAGAYGDASAEWKDGKMCLITPQNCLTKYSGFADCKRMAPIISKFRIYTFDRSTIDVTDDYQEQPEAVPAGPTLPETPSTNAVVKDGWVFPTPNWRGSFGTNVWGSCSVQCRHQGIDIGGGGMTVLAAHDGTIVKTNSTSSGYGGGYIIQVTKNNQPQNLYYAYQHMSSAPLSAGTTVRAGQSIGISGCTGNCRGPHIHFSIEKTNHISTYKEGAGKSDLAMPTLPPLCFLPTSGINLGSQASATTGSAFCSKFGL